ncbi:MULTISPECIES: hypothetical protein [Microcystis]|uniref:hypothetical protein n=1 Tax=Microcystis TaxID=1125 RepID=UPI000D203FA3|nr:MULTISPECIES: hypothetical protein [Microcystis]AVQ74077.1 hypothetical protein B5D77_24795 [Microcystis sp. MC19]GCA87235.1 hypothetical protein MiTa_00561 [Microcystis aeruginosa NIES-4264]
MSQKNEILPLLLTVMVTSALLGGIAWWLLNKTFPNLNDRSNSSSSNSQISETLGAVKNVPEGLFNYGGSTTWAPIRKEVGSSRFCVISLIDIGSIFVSFVSLWFVPPPRS